MNISTKSSGKLSIKFYFSSIIFLYIDDTYVVNQTYEGKSQDEISLHQGSFVNVLEKSYTGWWIVQ